MIVNFIKMQGTGNDFVVIDAREKPIEITPKMAERLSHRRFGVGADQVLVIAPSGKADVRMRIFNADGSEVEHCGNGIRCLAKYVTQNGRSQKRLSVETLSGVQTVAIVKDRVRVDMGPPELEGEKIPVRSSGRVIAKRFSVGDLVLEATCVSMGNPHVVIPVASVDPFPVAEIGPQIENDPFFPNRTNVEFVEFVHRHQIKMRVWERGAGETWACGTGACAAVVAGVLLERSDRRVEVDLKGGRLDIEWDERTNHVFMTGPAEEVYRGVIEIE